LVLFYITKQCEIDLVCFFIQARSFEFFEFAKKNMRKIILKVYVKKNVHILLLQISD
jgi:hypothetical protein